MPDTLIDQLRAIHESEGWVPPDRLAALPIASPAELAAAIRWAFAHLDPEGGHVLADQLLLRWIGDAGVTAAFEEGDKWYS